MTTAFFDPREMESKPKKEVDFLPVDNYVGIIENVFVFKKDGQTKLVLTFCVLAPHGFKHKIAMDWLLLEDANQDAKEQAKVYYGKKRLAQLLTALYMGDRPLNDPKILEKQVVKFLVSEYNGKNRFVSYAALSESDLKLIPTDIVDDVAFDAAVSQDEIPF